jgi:hypothetical protein
MQAYLRLTAEKHALELCLGGAAFRSIGEHPFHPHYSTSGAVLEYDLGSLRWWTNYGEVWHECGVRALELMG